jgi:HlyD family secretion protein
VTAAVQRQDLRQIVQAAGTVESTKTIDLSFNAGGTITTVNASVGKQVKSGELLASVAAQKQEAQLAVAQGALQAAQADLLKVTSGASAEDLDVSNQKVAQAQASLQSSQSALAALQQQQVADLANWRSSLWQSLNANVFVGTRAANEEHRVLTNEEARALYGIVSSNDYNQAVAQDNLVRSRLDSLTQLIPGISTTDDVALVSSSNEVITTLTSVQTVLNECLSLLQRIYVTVQFTQTELDALKSTVATQQANVSASVSAVEAAKAALINGQADNATKIDAASSAVTDAQAGLNLAQAQARSVAAPARQFEVAQAQAKVAQAQGDLQSAAATLEDYRLHAPVDGVITRVDIRAGQQVTAGVPAVAILGIMPLQIKVKVAEADIAKVQVGQTATIRLDAFGDSHPFSGTVASVDQAPTLIEGVVYYYVTVVFVDEAIEVKLGMSADVDILTAARQQVLVVPARSIKSRGSDLYVQVANAQGILSDKPVTMGLRGEDGLVEILSGLIEGEQVVTLNRTP